LATKLKKLIKGRALKAISFTLTVILIIQALLIWFNIYYKNLNSEALFVREYSYSESFHSIVSKAINDIRNQMINKNSSIIPEPEYLYYISDGENEYKNADINKILEYGKYLYKFNGSYWEIGEKAYKNIYNYVDENHTLYLAFTDDYMEERQMEWEEDRAKLLPLVITIFTSILFAVLCIIYLIAVTGRKSEDDQVHLSPYMDRIYSDISLGIMMLTVFLWSASFYKVEYRYGNDYVSDSILSMNQIIIMIALAVSTGITTIICGVLLLSLVRKIKARRLIKHTMIYVALSGFSNFIRSFFNNSSFDRYPLTKTLDIRQLIFTVSSGGMVFLTFVFIANGIFFLGLLPIFVEGVIIFWYFYENRKTYEKINKGFDESMQEQMKSERMKVDLITNVSHDLKTPLTSIISYVDLLSNEELPESARDYVSILADKSERLKNIVSDLFDLAKSTSGNLPLNMETIDLKRLIEQTLGDMEDEIEKSQIRIKTSLTDQPVYIYSDGKKLYRVFQNILGNAIKYSLQGTRVFIDMQMDDRSIWVIVKNTASYDMDFTSEEILQRFNRGDDSRTSEGSGLGLSIAESFTKACGGEFEIEIDGDQFKVSLEFTRVRSMPAVTSQMVSEDLE